MRQPADKFAQALRRIRKAKGWASTTLSKAVGKDRSFLGIWERETRPVNKQVLYNLCRVLDLTEAERAQLFTLADQRNRPNAASRSYSPAEQLLLNVHQALGEIEHTLPAEPSVDSLYAAGECAAWLLTRCAADGRDPNCWPDALAWPPAVFRKRIINRKGWDQLQLHPIPPELIQQELPDIDSLGTLTADVVHKVAAGVVNVYRRWLLSDLDRCRMIAKALHHWGLTEDANTGPVVVFLFDSLDYQPLNVPGVRCAVAIPTIRRDIIGSLWNSNNCGEGDDFDEFPFRFDVVDSLAYTSFQVAKGYLAGRLAPDLAEQRQNISDALFVVQSEAWESPYAARGLYPLLADDDFCKSLVPAVEQLDLDQLYSLYPQLQAARQYVIDTLTSAIRKMDLEVARARLAASPTGAAKAKSKRKRRAKRRQGKKNTTKKRGSQGAKKVAAKPAKKAKVQRKRKR